MDLDVDGRALAVVSAGGVLGALTRYAAGVAWPHAAGGFPWSTWSVNVSGCFLIGALLTLLGRFRPGHRLTRLFLGTGVLGGYTTFSTAANDVLRAPAPTGLAYLAATVAGALLAVWAGSSLASLGGPADGKPVSGAPTGERLPSGPADGKPVSGAPTGERLPSGPAGGGAPR